MASEIANDGHVIPPLNITAPAPFINLRGFHWDTVDAAIHGPQPAFEEGQTATEPAPEDQTASEPAEEGQTATEPAQESQTATEPARDDEPPQMQDAFAAPPPDDQQPQMQAVSAAAQPPPEGRRPGPGPPKAPQPGPLPAPQLPISPETVGTQLPVQLGFTPGQKAPVPPLFPLAQFQGAYAGNGFNMIFRPRPRKDQTVFPITPQQGPDDNVLELNLTTEQLTFGPTIGNIPNRGLNLNEQPDINLGGLPYLQTVQDVTNPVSGKGDRMPPIGIHFEPGMWLNVPASGSPKNEASVVRMASIPHGTTINAQGFFPPKGNTTLGGFASGPRFDTLDTTPFQMNDPSKRIVGAFLSMDADRNDTPRIPQNLKAFQTAGTITTAIIKNPNLVLQRAVQGQKIVETITFQVSTGTPDATLNGGGTANISFLAGTQDPITNSLPDTKTGVPNAHAAVMTSRFWIETVAYEVNVPRLTTKGTLLLKPTMPKDSTAPTPVFAVSSPGKLPSEARTVTVPGIQIQYTQIVNLNFAGLTWPHVSVATLVPTGAQPFAMTSSER